MEQKSREMTEETGTLNRNKSVHAQKYFRGNLEGVKNGQHMFSNRDLCRLLIPLIIEQLLNSLMGMVDTMMVSNVGSEAISAVALVDSINLLVIQVFSALAAGGTIICSQYLGRRDDDKAKQAAQQLVLVIAGISVMLSVVCLIFRIPLLRLIFGEVEPAVMANSETYFFYTAMSYPFFALFGAGSSIFRAQEDSRTPMIVSVISNVLNIAGNAALIWGFGMGVAGAAIATLASRIFSCVAVLWLLHSQKCRIPVRDYRGARLNLALAGLILSVGIPSGIENGMFQFGKLAIQSTVSTLGTTAIAAQAMTSILEGLNGIAGIGVGIGLMTIVGECIGAGRKDEAVYYIKKLMVIAEAVVLLSCLIVYASTRTITVLAGMEPESADMCLHMMGWITLVKPIVWIFSFILAYGMRAAGDVKYSMVVSCVTMWTFRVTLCILLCRRFGFGPIAVWIGMFTDWTARGVLFTLRFLSGRWAEHHIVK